MSGFRDTFSKNDEEEGLLSYDDSAFYYFAGTILICALIPCTYYTIKGFLPKKSARKKEGTVKASHTSLMAKMDEEELEGEKRDVRKNLSSNLKRLAILGFFWLLFAYCMTQVGGGNTEVRRFDPFNILGVEHDAADRDIKKAYHRLAKEYHPDKNPDDPLAGALFIQIKKAYDCLTDDVAKKNFEKYGNPDGPTTTKVGIGLPAWLLSKDNQIGVLIGFFLIIIIIIPSIFISYYNRTKKYAPNGVLLETMQFLGHHISEVTRFKMLPELFAASAESRALTIRPSDNADMKPVMDNTVEGSKRRFNVPIVVRNQFLIWAHLQRQHLHMSVALKDDLKKLLIHSPKICQVMVEISCMREWFFTAQSVLEFHRCLIQGIDTKNKGFTLLQIPHYDEEQVKHALRGKKAMNSIKDFIKQDSPERRALTKMTEEQQADIDDFLGNFPDVTLDVKVYVEDEDEIVVGDIVTVEYTLTRNHLDEGQTQGFVHAPLYPKPVSEEWWIFLLEPSGQSRILGFERQKSQERVITDKIRFQAGKAGKFNYLLHALSDSYLGIDQKAEVSFKVKSENEVKRELFVHPDDVELDKVPTLFEQFVGAVKEDDSDDEDDDEPKKKKEENDSDDSSSGSSSDSDSDSDDDAPKKK